MDEREAYKICLDCGFNDADFGCICPSLEPWLCPLEDPAEWGIDGYEHKKPPSAEGGRG